MGAKSRTFLEERIIRLAHEHAEFRGELAPAIHLIAKDKDALKRREDLSQMMEFGGSFGALSANQGSDVAKNKQRRAQLMADLLKAGYRKLSPIPGGPAPNSILVQNMLPQDLFLLGRKYNQDQVLFKGKDGVIGLYSLKGEPKAEVGIKPKGDPAFQIATDPSLYVRTKDMSFDFGFLWADPVPWDGLHAIDRRRFQLFVERGSLTDA